MTEVIKTNTHEQVEGAVVPEEIRNRILAKLATQPNFISDGEFERALVLGWNYGLTLVNGFKPESQVLKGMVHEILGTKDTDGITSIHYVPTMYVVDASAREAKRTLTAAYPTEHPSEDNAPTV